MSKKSQNYMECRELLLSREKKQNFVNPIMNEEKAIKIAHEIAEWISDGVPCAT